MKQVDRGPPGQGHTTLCQPHKGITLTVQGSGESGHRVGEVAVAEVVWLQQEAHAIQGVDSIVHDLSSWTEVRCSFQRSSNTIGRN